MRLLLLLGLIACDAGLPLPAPTTPPPPDVAAPLATAGGRTYAIVRVMDAWPEPCMDGQPASNWAFSVEGSALKLFGHGRGMLGETESDTGVLGRYYVAEIELSHGQIQRPVTCNGIESFDGTVRALTPAHDLADARAKLAEAKLDSAPLPAAAILANPIISADGRQYAILKLEQTIPEACTDMGGTDWMFSVEGMPADFKLHGGGHGIFAEGSTLPSVMNQSSVAAAYYVAEVQLATHGKISLRFHCNGNRELMSDGSVVAVVPASSLDEARAKLAAVTRGGLADEVRIDRFDGSSSRFDARKP